MAKRPKIPKDTEAAVLSRSRHICNICHDPKRKVQIHHIDGNNANNSVDNLIVLCLEHHDEVASRGLGKSYTEKELKAYRNDWETLVRLNLFKGYTIGEPATKDSDTSRKLDLLLSRLDTHPAPPPDADKNERLLFETRHHVHLLADYLRDKKDYEKAAEVYADIIETDPNAAEYAILNRASLLGKMGKAKGAAEELQRSLEKKPRDVNLLLLTSSLLTRSNQHSKAIEFLDRALAISPADELALHLKGEALLKLGKPKEALDVLMRLRKVAPDESYVAQHIAEAYCLQDNHKDALSYRKLALSKESGNARLLHDVGAELVQLGRPRQALKYYTASLEKDPRNPQALTAKGWLLAEHLNKPSEGIEYFDQALRFAPNDSHILSHKGYALISLGQFTKANPIFDKLLAAKPKDRDILVGAAICNSRIGNTSKALIQLAKLVTLSKTPPKREELERYPFSQKFKRDPRFKRILDPSGKRAPKGKRNR